MCAATSLGQLSYASFYLPPLTFGYLSVTDNNPLIAYLNNAPIDMPFISLEPTHFFWFLTAFTFLGAMQVHGVTRAIYGREGPGVRPKQKTVQVRHSLAFALGTDADNIPVVPCRLIHSNIGREILKDIEQDRDRLKTAIQQLMEIGSLMSWKKLPRFLYFIPMGLHRFFGKVAFGALASVIYLGAGGYATLLLFAALFVLLFRKVIWTPLPPIFNQEALDDRFIPEYRVVDIEGEDKPRPRIQPTRSNE